VGYTGYPMSEPRFSRDRWLDEQLTVALRGDERINAVTRDNAEVAYLIGTYIKRAYEIGLDYTSRVTDYIDYDRRTQAEAGRVALECLDAANQKADDKAQELGII